MTAGQIAAKASGNDFDRHAALRTAAVLAASSTKDTPPVVDDLPEVGRILYLPRP